MTDPGNDPAAGWAGGPAGDLAIDPGPRRLGLSGLEAGPIAYGMWRFAGADVATARARIEAALAAGMTLFDTADIYGIDDGLPVGAAEELFGAVLADAPHLREQMVIATKCGIVPGVPYDSSPSHIKQACEASLRRLRIETIDLYQIHRPDLLAHPAEVAEALADLRQAGKIREIGVSNYTAAQTVALQRHLGIAIATHQPEFSALTIAPVSDGVFDLCMAETITPLAWSPLAGGRLMVDPGEAETTRQADVITCLEDIARARALSRATVALAWVMAHPARPIPIIGSRTPLRIAEAAAALDVVLTRREWYRVYEAALGCPLP